MKNPTLSSSDLVADRRAGYARMYAEAGDFVAAAELMRQTLEERAEWAAGWFSLGLYEEKAGNIEAACAAFSKTLMLAPEDIFGAGLKLAAHGRSPAPDRQVTAYVERLFDDYAERFDQALLERLDYSLPEALTEMIFASGNTSFAHAIDLGCGTGLMGERLRKAVRFLQGFDLSHGMLAKARAKGVYDRLEQADLADERPWEVPTKADLVVAADVFNYLGDLSPAFRRAAALGAPDGLFAFSVEANGEPDAVALRASLRFAHGENYVRNELAKAGFSVARVQRLTLRRDAGEPVAGVIFLARRQPGKVLDA
jgi:predicted TPR repeat methyltransferase